MPSAEPLYLFICTGNTCRSPMAAALMNRLLRERGLPGRAESAGLAAAPGEPASRNAVLAAAERGADLSAHRARPADAVLMERSAAVFAMTSEHLRLLEARFPAQRDKLRLLGPHGIPDPFGGDLAAYRRCRDAIERALEPILREMTDHAGH